MTETIAIIGGILGLLTALVGFLIRLNRGMRRVMSMADDWNGEAARPGVPARPGVMERLAAVEDASTEIRYNVKSNNGHSAHDDVLGKLDAIQDNINLLRTGMRLSETDRENLHHDIDEIENRLSEVENRRNST